MDRKERVGYEGGCELEEKDSNEGSRKRREDDAAFSSSKKARSTSFKTAQILDAALYSEWAAEMRLNLARAESVKQEIEQKKINATFENIKVFKQSKQMEEAENDESVKKMLRNTCESILKLHSSSEKE